MSNLHSPLVTVIIPTFKTAEYLPRSVESILTQTHNNFELILVCDGDDRDYAICDHYAQLDGRISVIKDVKKGLGGARNAGIQAARGKYISFIDADDYVAKHFLQTAVDRLECSSADFFHCGTQVEYESQYPDNIVQGDREYFQLPCEGLQTFTDDMIGTVDVGAWNKVFRRDFLKKKNILFPEKMLNEDAYFVWCAFVSAKSIFFEKQKLYHYVRRDGSLMDETAFKRKDQVLRLDHLTVALMFYDFLQRNNLLRKFTQAFWNAYIVSVWYVLNNNPENFRSKIDDVIYSFIKDKDFFHLDDKKFYDLFRVYMSHKKRLPAKLKIKTFLKSIYRTIRRNIW